MRKEFSFVHLFEQFIRDSSNGKRLKPNGQKIKPQTVDNYRYVLGLLQEFIQLKGMDIRIRPVDRLSQRQLRVEMNYWKKFYRAFSDFLYKERKCFDNYVGTVFKIIRVFFNYLKKDKLINTGDFHKNFYVRKEEIPIVTLMPNQLQFLINDKTFEASLSMTMKKTKDIFVFGCTVALRCSDLFNLRYRDIECVDGAFYLTARSIKTEVTTRVKLPAYAIDIINKYKRRKTADSKIFNLICKSQLNKNIRKLAELAGWTYTTGKMRKQNGNDVEMLTPASKKTYRFCDLLSSHAMRRTAVTTMLMLGMPEHIVRKISGHSLNGKAFYRYVNFVQSYMDHEIDKVHQKLAAA
jgi:hypothetical protein